MFDEERHFQEPIPWAMVGGGRSSQIGYAHRSGAARDRLFQLVAGAFDANPSRGREFGVNLGIEAQRCYPDYKTLFEAEARRKDGIRAVTVATPNSTHYEICKAALERGLHVVCEKPVTFTATEAEALKRLAVEGNRVLGVMYGYSGFPMIHQAREMVRRGDLGEIRIVTMQFAHGFHSQPVEDNDPGAKWRVSPSVSGPTYVLGDIGTHAFYLGELISGLKVERLACMRQSFVASRAPLEDNAHVMLQFEGGAVGTLWASAVNAGSMHQQRIRVVGSKASIEWWDEHPNQLRYEVQGEPARVMDRGMPYLYGENPAVGANRIGGGHAEGFFESWANIYHRFALAVDATERDDQGTLAGLWYPDIDVGIEGIRFCEKCVESADNGAKWVAFQR